MDPLVDFILIDSLVNLLLFVSISILDHVGLTRLLIYEDPTISLDETLSIDILQATLKQMLELMILKRTEILEELEREKNGISDINGSGVHA